LQELLVPTWHI